MTTTTVSLPFQRNRFDPPGEAASIRDREGVRHIAGMPYAGGQSGYLVSRYEDVRRVLSDSVKFGMAQSDLGEVSAEQAAEFRAGQLLELDPPDHTRLRRMLRPAFTARRIAALEKRIVTIVEAALDDVEKAGRPADLVATFALPVPSLVICELLGVPYDDRDEFQERARGMVDTSLSLEEQTRLYLEDREYMAGLVARTRANPGDNLLGMLVRDHGHELSTAELIGIASLLLVAGHETTSNMLALGTLALLCHPDQLALVRDDPAAAKPAVEELLRWLSVVPTGMGRLTKTEVTIAGHTIDAGKQIIVGLPAANRDPRIFENPEQLNVRRAAPSHVAFGHGVHHCLGAPLARLEMGIAFPALLRRFPRLALAVPLDDIEFRDHHVVYGVRELPVTW